MAFVDEIILDIKAGNGGNGVVRWRHEKGKEFSGPSGGNGGKGGDVFVRAVRDFGILARYRNNKKFESENGADGEKNSMHGKDGADLVIDIPIGAIITDPRFNREIQLVEDGEKVKILSGGKGGLGNEYFKASTNIRPIESTEGRPGEEASFKVEVRLFADAGLIGLPNAGKSSLLNVLTNANAKVGSYQFTTLEPNLGDMHGFIIADIPGLIEGASEGKGLGHKFLRHISRTKMLFHCISLEHMLPGDEYGGGAEGIDKVHNVIRKELKTFSEELSIKPELIILTKTDAVDVKTVTVAKKVMQKYVKKTDILAVSVLDDQSCKDLKDELVKRLRKASKKD